MSRRRSAPATSDAADKQLVCKLASLVLCYPNDALYAALDDIATVSAGLEQRGARDGLGRTVTWLRGQPRDVAERHFVEAFDLTRRVSPYLTYYRYGDTRQRGMALLALKHTYRIGGFEVSGSELPDYLPAVLEFAAMTAEIGMRLLRTHQAGVELMRLGLRDIASPYAGALDAVAAILPRLSAKQVADVRKLAAEGPPSEDVGLDPVGTAPFAPPEMLGGLVR